MLKSIPEIKQNFSVYSHRISGVIFVLIGFLILWYMK
jgi:uncharacterized protein YjeT (DUF2065 family)